MAASSDTTFSLLIKERAFALGFDLCGIAPSRPLEDHEPILRNWCSSGMNGDMGYLGKRIEKRINPGLLFAGAKSVIVTGLNYYSEKKQGGNGIPVISRYAYGNNYHDVILDKLNKLLEFIIHIRPESAGKAFVDSAPIIEKAWAREAGLGWPGRHSILINNKLGSFFFLGVIIINLDLDYDKPFSEDHCGSCRFCIDSCPTGAINENRTIDVRKCIAYLTIEAKNPAPEELALKMEGRVFGCDKCQEVCPWNARAMPNKIPEFQLSAKLKKMTSEDWTNLSGYQFDRLFKKSAIGRRTYERFIQNVTIVTKTNNGFLP
jgi:epoxyqueuosine reductase